MIRRTWDELPRLLQELCEGGCGTICAEVFARDIGNGRRLWECKGCFTRNESKAEGRYIEADLRTLARARKDPR